MRILIIEDEDMLAQSLRTGFMDEQYAVDIFTNGRLGYEQAATEEYDAIILDIMLPEMDGITICRMLREEKNHTPIIMLTARDTIEDRVEGLDCGADDYLIKPFSFEELLARIRSLIRRTTVKETLLRVGSLTLNPVSHIVRRTNEEIVLTGKEYALLEYFMLHPNQILSREQILSHVWDYSTDLVSNTIEVLVKRLREKIDKAFPKEPPLFTTVRGIGYKIESI